jgi:flagellar motor switch protein FliG
MSSKKDKDKIRIPGKELASDILSRLDPENRDKILESISEKNQGLAKDLQEGMVTFNDLIYLTPPMLAVLMRAIEVKDLGLGLRGGSQELRDFVLQNVSQTTKEDINVFLLGPPRPLEQVMEAQGRVLKMVRKMISIGHIHINK